MGKLLSLALPDKLGSPAPKLLGSVFVSMREVRDRILNSGPEGAPKSVEILVVKAALKSASGTAKASIKKVLKCSMVVHVVLLPVAILRLGVACLQAASSPLDCSSPGEGWLGQGESQGGPNRLSRAWCKFACKEEGLRAIQAVLGMA